jgi:isopentenyl phosphate kinase
VKLGTGVLTDSRKQPDPAQLEQLVAQIAALKKGRQGNRARHQRRGRRGHGRARLRNRAHRPRRACRRAPPSASRGSWHLRQTFAAHGLHVAQVLLTHDDLEHHERHLNARNTLVTLLGRGVVPIINENDAVSFTEIKFGDNDKLSALVASLLPADLLVILTTVDGVIENFGKANPKTISVIEKIDSTIEKSPAARQRNRRRRHGVENSGGENCRAFRHPARHRVRQKEKRAGENPGRRGRRHAVRRAAEQIAGPQTLDRVFPSSARRAVRGRRREAGVARRAKACCRPAWRAAKANLPPAMWCGFAIWTERNSRAASRSSAPPPSAPKNWRAWNWCIATIW